MTDRSDWTGCLNMKNKVGLTAGPLGRAVLSELVGVSWLTNMDVNQVLDHNYRDRVRLALSRLGENPDGITTATGLVVADYAFGAASEWRRHEQSLTALMPLLNEAAGILAISESIAWWWDNVELTSQRWIQEVSSSALPRATSAQVTKAAAEFHSISGWWSPLLDPRIPRTTRGPLKNADTVEFLCHEDSYFYQSRELKIREFHPVADAQVYEISSAADWANLVDRFPKTATTHKAAIWNDMFSMSEHWIEPDWEAVSEAFDGVHISVAGYLSAAYDPIKNGSYRTVLAGWNPDQTLWLREGFVLGRSVASVDTDKAIRRSD